MIAREPVESAGTRAGVADADPRSGSGVSAAGNRSRLAYALAGALFLLYLPVLAESAHVWLTNEADGHCIFMLPIAAALVWVQRRQVSEAAEHPRSDAWGLWILLAALCVETASYLLRVRYLGMWSLTAAIAAAILMIYGRPMLDLLRFPVAYTLLAAPLPSFLIQRPSEIVQNISTTGAHVIMESLGYTVSQAGNLLEIPGMTLEVADVCSGFRKLFAFVAFALLYGYLFPISRGKRLLLVAAAVPIAVLANVLRIAGLIAVSSAGGEAALRVAHNFAEAFVLVIAFVCFAFVGKVLGCRTIRFSW